jgi:hypothetical protein
MSEQEMRLQQLQQIPVFALRQVVYRLIEDRRTEGLMQERFLTVLNRKPRHMRRAVQRLTREQITRLIDACPEISDDQIRELFEEYRYGSNPSFYIYLFDTKMLGHEALTGFRQRFENKLEVFNKAQEQGLPRVRHLALNDLGSLPERPEIIEGNYRFQARLDYIDEDQNALSTYQTLYGFFWLNTVEGYATIHARNPQVLKALKHALEKGADIYLTPLVISKQLKNALPFLLQESFRSGRLHDPDPGSDRFRWLTIADDDPYAKGYQSWEERYPEVRSARYRELIGEAKETSLTIRCDRGALSLAGTLKASQFRAWCLDRLGQLIRVLNEFRANAPAYVETLGLANAPEMARLNASQRRYVLEIISALLTLKQAPQLGYQTLRTSPLDLAAEMDRLIRVQIPFECAELNCYEEGYLACPMCGATLFTFKHQDSTWQLECGEHRRQRWTGALPLSGQCDQEHAFTLTEDDLASGMELLPGPDLLQVIAGVVNRYLPGYTFDPSRESFIVRGPNLLYYPDKTQVRDSGQDGVKIIQVYGGDYVAGDKVLGDKVGGDKVTVGDVSGSTGIAIGRAGQATVTQGLGGDEIARMFVAIYQQIEARPEDPDVDKKDLAGTVQKIQDEVGKGAGANLNKVERWLETLAGMANDIFEVTVACLANPVAGVAAVIRKVAEKAKERAK